MVSSWALALVVVIGVAAVAGAYLSVSSAQNNTPSITTSTTSELATSSSESLSTTASTTSSTASSGSVTQTVPECSGLSPPSFGFGNITASTSSPAVICVQLYYYNLATPLTLNTTSALTIVAGTSSGTSNFTVKSSAPEVTLGGPGDENEGTVVGFAITAKPGASGTYQLGFSLGYLLAQSPESCGDYGLLIAGSGQPNYAKTLSTCITYDTSTSTSTCTDMGMSGMGSGMGAMGCNSCGDGEMMASMNCMANDSELTIAGIPYPLLSGDTYFGVVGVTR